MSIDVADQTNEHGVKSAGYSGGPGRVYYQPSISCTCGWGVREETWELVGQEYDEHLAEVEEISDAQR